MPTLPGSSAAAEADEPTRPADECGRLRCCSYRRLSRPANRSHRELVSLQLRRPR